MARLYAEVRAHDEPGSAWAQWRRTRDELFENHPQSPLNGAVRTAFTGLRYYPYDPGFRFCVSLTPLPPRPSQSQHAGEDGVVDLTPFALTAGLEPRLGAELTLYWIGGYGGGVFLPFRDTTSGAATYAGGRYLIDTVKGAELESGDSGAVLDFNFAYNPSCAYSEAWVCPLAPGSNHLPAALEAGEKAPDRGTGGATGR